MKTATPRAWLDHMAPPPGAVWTSESNPAVAELLDHLAEELAREYVRLMEVAMDEHREAPHE